MAKRKQEPVPARVRPGDLWALGEHRLLCGDSADTAQVARLMQGETAALVFTSPPYDRQRNYGRVIANWHELMVGVFAALPARDDTQVLVNLGLVHRKNEWVPYWDSWVEWMRGQGWRRFGLYVWDQGPGLVGDWSGRLAPSFEFVFHFNKRARRPCKTVPCKLAGKPRNRNSGGFRGPDGIIKGFSHEGAPTQSHRIPDSVIRVSRHKSHHGPSRLAPAVFPVALCLEFHAAYSNLGDVVLDPFGGSGTSLLSCERLGRRGYMMELEPAYCDIALARWEYETGRKAELLERIESPDELAA